jgi:hypothetical protein
MPQTIAIPNYNSNNIINDSNTQLTSTINAGVNSLPVQDVDDFSNSGYVLIGQKGGDTSELLQIGSITTATAIPLTTNTAQGHNQYDPVYPLFGNQIRIYRAANVDGTQPADSAFNYGTPYATVAIDYSEPQTTYTDATGGGGYWYKFTYYNSTSTNETDIGSSTAVRGNFTVNYASLDDIRGAAGFKHATYIDDSKIEDARQAAQDEINGALNAFYEIPLQPPISDYIRRMTTRLAAGYLRLDQYSQVSNPAINGQDMVDEAQEQLEKLILKEREIMTKDGKALDEPGATGGVDGWPNESTDTAPSSQGGAPRNFRMSDIQGQPITYDSSGNPVGNPYYGRKW